MYTSDEEYTLNKTFVEQLSDYVNASKNDKLNKHKFLKHQRVKNLNHMVDLLEVLGVLQGNIVYRIMNLTEIDRHLMVQLLVDKYYKAPR